MNKARTGETVCSLPKARPVAKWAALMAVAALICALIPLYAAAQYSYAGVDDYRYGATTHAVWAETGSLGATLAEAARVAGKTYVEWQGSLSAIFLMALQPGIFSDGAYGLSTVLLLSVLVASLLVFCWTLCRVGLQMGQHEALALGALLTLCCVAFVPTPVESYYWFNGGVYYTFYFSLSLFAAALLIQRLARRTGAQWLLLAPLLLLIGTGNLVTALLSCVGLALYVLWSFFCKRERDLTILLALLVLLAAFAVNVFAPGNGVRQAEHPEKSLGAVAAILAALRDGAVYSLHWLAGPTPFVLLLAAPLVWRWAGTCACRFRFPLLVAVGSFLLLSAGFAPNEYAQGFAGEARIIDIQFYLFTLLLFVNLIWSIGWLRKRVRLTNRAARRAACAGVAVCALLAGLSAVYSRNVAPVSAAHLLANGSGQSYAAAWEARLLQLRDPAQTTVMLQKLDRQPPLLCMVDVAVDETGEYFWYNEQLAAYFGKVRVLREP